MFSVIIWAANIIILEISTHELAKFCIILESRNYCAKKKSTLVVKQKGIIPNFTASKEDNKLLKP